MKLILIHTNYKIKIILTPGKLFKVFSIFIYRCKETVNRSGNFIYLIGQKERMEIGVLGRGTDLFLHQHFLFEIKKFVLKNNSCVI